jgi:hypothetical protein
MEAYPHHDAWARAELALAQGTEGRTVKLVIDGRDLYVKVAFAMAEARPVHIDITLGHSPQLERRYETLVANELATQLVDDARAQLEVICRQASALMQLGVWGLEDLQATWRGTKFSPAGFCPQVCGFVSSPLDAVARYL